MPKSPSRRKAAKTDAPPSVISLPTLQKTAAADLTPMNFRVPESFHREFKLYAVQHGMSMVDLLQEAFRLVQEKRGR
jgi:hypothetical protein